MTFSKEEKEMWVEDWRRSGKTAWAYAKENGLIPQTFNGWTRNRGKTTQPLVEVSAGILQSTRPTQELLIEKGEVRIHIPLEPVLGEVHAIIKRIGQTI